jgi:hypothetical protein
VQTVKMFLFAWVWVWAPLVLAAYLVMRVPALNRWAAGRIGAPAGRSCSAHLYYTARWSTRAWWVRAIAWVVVGFVDSVAFLWTVVHKNPQGLHCMNAYEREQVAHG